MNAVDDAEVERLAARPYHYELARERDGTWFIRVVELKGCMSVGDAPNEAVAMIEEAMRAWIRVGLQCADPIPEPLDVDAWVARR